MSNVKWIRLTLSMFDDEKIRLIEQMPDADTILMIWIKLLVQAGKVNASGSIFLNENIPYTDEMLATIFDRPISTVRLALDTFKQFGMISIDENSIIHITNWEKHQNVEGLEKIREQNRIRQARYRKRKQIEAKESSNDKENQDSNVTVTSRNGTEEELEEELDKERDSKYIVEIINYLNDVAGRNYRTTTRKTRSLIRARMNEGFTVDDFKKVIDIKIDEWKDNPKMQKFIRPETLFGTKFESYLNQKTTISTDDGYDYGF